MKRGLVSAIWIALALLGLSVIWTKTGQQESLARPSIRNDGPSGVSALAALLRKRGWEVVLDTSVRPKLRPGDLAILLTTDEPPTFFDEEVEADPLLRSLERSLEKDGRVAVMPIQALFNTQPNPLEVSVWGEPRTVAHQSRPFFEEPPVVAPEEWNSWTLWEAEDFAYVAIYGKGEARILVFDDALAATNRFIDRDDNAEVVVSSLEGAVGEGGRMVFLGASAGDGARGSLLGAIGPWAPAAWNQVLVVFGLIIFTLGKRFGLPEETRRAQRSTRDFVDAVAFAMQRGRYGRKALELAVRRADRRIRQAYKLPKDAPVERRNDVLSPACLAVLTRCEYLLSQPDLEPFLAERLVLQLDEAVNHYLHAKTPAR